MAARRRRICFVTGTRAEFGLMRSTLNAIAGHPELRLQLAVTGMHLDPAHGRSIDQIRRDGWSIDRTVPWPRASNPSDAARRMGTATAGLADAFERLGSDVVLVVGDRVEAFAAAAAGHASGRVVAHVHGGDRALGQIDDSLRHAITKLSHVHFPATAASARRIRRLGEDLRRIHTVGTPGIDGITAVAARRGAVRAEFPGLRVGRYALLLYHPETGVEETERRAATLILNSTLDVGFDGVILVAPNNDPGARGVLGCWNALGPKHPRVVVHKDLPRQMFLALMRDAAVLVGNSSSGIIEAASFGTPVVDVGRRQAGRERSGNVVNVPAQSRRIREALAAVWRDGRPRRFRGQNVYGGDGAGRKIASILARLSVDDGLMRKLIAY